MLRTFSIASQKSKRERGRRYRPSFDKKERMIPFGLLGDFSFCIKNPLVTLSDSNWRVISASSKVQVITLVSSSRLMELEKGRPKRACTCLRSCQPLAEPEAGNT